MASARVANLAGAGIDEVLLAQPANELPVDAAWGAAGLAECKPYWYLRAYRPR